ncbi:hypothetical protein VB773_01050 [Haloarculaceae archaeon H-GB2-1]|nr:hypothetical protein [Haloarculaceae archaeon H-GB1-1]MEA5406307.1 hypothetical protein [Haloarculaceae archaeon H-GB2-1]
MTDDNDVYTPAQFREYQDGYGHRDPDVHRHAGLVRDARLSRYLSVVQTHYDPLKADEPGKMPGLSKDLRHVRDIVAVEGTEAARKAMEVGDTQTLKHFTGDCGQRADVSGIKAIGNVDDLINGPAPVIVVLGEMGAGKTDFACLLAQRWMQQQSADSLVGTNIQSLEEKTRWVDSDGDVQDGWIPDYGTLMEWVEQDGDPLDHSQRPKLFMGDEFSSAASGVGAQGYETRMKMAPLVYKIRKYGGALIYIAHGERSIHPMLWRVGTIVKKTSQKKAVVADAIKSSKLADIQFEIEGIPPTDWRYNTKEASDWSWSDGDDENAVEADETTVKQVAMWTIKECKDRGMSDRETSEYVPYSHATVRNWWNDYRDGGPKREWVGNVEAVIT